MKRLTVLASIAMFLILVTARCSIFNNASAPANASTQTSPVTLQGPLPTSAPSPIPQSSPVPSQPNPPAQLTPTPLPTSAPTSLPSTNPAPLPSQSPTSLPSSNPTSLPSTGPTPSPSPTPTAEQPSPSPTGDSSSTSSSGCIDKAAFSADVTYPDGALVEPGQHFTKTWQIHNEGTCDWSGYSLIYAGGDAMNASMSTPIQDVKTDAYANISIDLVASTRGGPDTGYFEFKNASGQTFGVDSGGQGLIWVQITVDYPTPAATAAGGAPGPAPTPQPGSNSGTSGNCSYTLNNDYVNQILDLINTARKQNGLGAVTLNPKLSAAAFAHSLDMACNDFVSHDGSDGSTWYDRVKAQKYSNYTSTRENIYVGNPAFGGDAQGCFTWWMNSKIHHDNILYPTVSEVGIAYVYNAKATYGGYYTLDLARP